MEDTKDRRSLRNLKRILLISIPIYLISSYLTGIRSSILMDGQIVDRGYYEHFTFLIIASIFLVCLLPALHFFVPSVDNKKMKFGLKTVSLALVLFGAVLLFCVFSSLFNEDNKWGDFEFMLVFLTSVPLTSIFLIGLTFLVFGKLSSFYSDLK